MAISHFGAVPASTRDLNDTYLFSLLQRMCEGISLTTIGSVSETSPLTGENLKLLPWLAANFSAFACINQPDAAIVFHLSRRLNMTALVSARHVTDAPALEIFAYSAVKYKMSEHY